MQAFASLASRIPGRMRSGSGSLSALPPPRNSSEYDPDLAKIAASILYPNPVPSRRSKLPIYILNAAAFPDSFQVDYNSLLPYVLARLPGEHELLEGQEYEIVFLAGGEPDTASGEKKEMPSWTWYIQAYYVLSRIMRKRIQKLYFVHERNWVRMLTEVFSTIVSPKFRRKTVHVSTFSELAEILELQDLLIPPSAYLFDRSLSPNIHVPSTSQTIHRTFGARHPLSDGTSTEGSTLPRVLRETTTFLLMEPNIRTEGLFRIPANMKLKECLREAYDRDQQFIVWKDNGVTLPIHGVSSTTLDEIEPKDAYGVHMAAGLIKLWYSELREPIFPTTMYPLLRQQREEMNSNAVICALPALSREILTRHLLPLLSAVAAESKYNLMTPENLAVCFGPTLVCGTDPIEDAKMSSIVRRVLQETIEDWGHAPTLNLPEREPPTLPPRRKPTVDEAVEAGSNGGKWKLNEYMA